MTSMDRIVGRVQESKTGTHIATECADCGSPVWKDRGPKDGWQLEDGRTVCHACCVKDLDRFRELLNECSDGG